MFTLDLDEELRDRFLAEAEALDRPVAAAGLDRLFTTAVQKLVAFTHLGRIGRRHCTREIMPHPRYRIVYAVRETVILIRAIVRTARRWPPLGP